MSASLRLTAAIFVCSAVFVIAGIFSIHILAALSHIWLSAPSRDIAGSIAASSDLGAIKKVCLALVDVYQEEREDRFDWAWVGLGMLIAFGTFGMGVSARLYVLLGRLKAQDMSGGSRDISPPRSPVVRLLSHSFAGTLELWKAFWLIYLPMPALLWVMLLGGYKALQSIGLKGPLIQLVAGSLLSAIVYVLFIAATVLVWRCSRNTSLQLWTYMARAVVVLIVLVPLVRIAMFWGRVL